MTEAADTSIPKSVGRPRSFEANAALDRAVRLFWRHGYDATSISDLVSELGVSAPSLYAAFGNKAGLFKAVVERYAATFSLVLYGPLHDEGFSARDAVNGLLERAALLFSEPETPAGCLMYSAAIAVAPGSAEIEELLRVKRAEAEAGLAARIARGIEAGELPRHADPAMLAKFINCVMEGMSIQARDGASHAMLLGIAATAVAAIDWSDTAHT